MVKKSACPCWRRGFDPWVRKIPWRRKKQPTPIFLPGEFHGQRSLMSYSPLSDWAQLWNSVNYSTLSLRPLLLSSPGSYCSTFCLYKFITVHFLKDLTPCGKLWEHREGTLRTRLLGMLVGEWWVSEEALGVGVTQAGWVSAKMGRRVQVEWHPLMSRGKGLWAAWGVLLGLASHPGVGITNDLLAISSSDFPPPSTTMQCRLIFPSISFLLFFFFNLWTSYSNIT